MSKDNDAGMPSVPVTRITPAPRCKTCGSEKVLRDAWARWDPIEQDWTVAAVFDHAICLSCDAETDIVFPEDEGPGSDGALRP